MRAALTAINNTKAPKTSAIAPCRCFDRHPAVLQHGRERDRRRFPRTSLPRSAARSPSLRHQVRGAGEGPPGRQECRATCCGSVILGSFPGSLDQWWATRCGSEWSHGCHRLRLLPSEEECQRVRGPGLLRLGASPGPSFHFSDHSRAPARGRGGAPASPTAAIAPLVVVPAPLLTPAISSSTLVVSSSVVPKAPPERPAGMTPADAWRPQSFRSVTPPDLPRTVTRGPPQPKAKVMPNPESPG